MRRRIFIAINFPQEIKQKLQASQMKWLELPAKWVRPENLHITLAFLGYVADEDLIEIFRVTREVASRHAPFLISLKKVCYGPPKKMPPRMVWASGERNMGLGSLQKDLENSLFSGPMENTKEPELRAYTPHVTLARIKQWDFRAIEPDERPQIDEDISLSFPVDSIEVMESQLKRGGAEYTILGSYNLKPET